jgi:SAM-dependent methyltransferase
LSTQFSEQQFNQAYSEGAENSYWNIARNRVLLHYLKKYKLNNILDVGCGMGIVTRYMHSHGLNVTGVELGNPPDQNLQSKSNSKHHPAIYYNTNGIELPLDIRQGIETITLFDVIEHIENPVEFMQGLSGAFPNLKNLVIAVPARKELWSNFDDHYGHFRRYTPALLKQETEQAGFETVFSRYFFHILYLLIRMNNLLVKNRKVELTAPKTGLSRLLNLAMADLFYPEVYMIPGWLLGSSVLCICRKKSS